MILIGATMRACGATGENESMYANLDKLEGHELLIAAGLWQSGPHRGDFKYLAFVAYAKELKRRKFTWDDARSAARIFTRRTRYPCKGWEAKYLKQFTK